MKVKVFIFTLLLATGLKAEFTDNSFNCFDKRGERVFEFGEYIQRGGLGQEIIRYDRTDFDREFATELRGKGLFGFRYTGPYFMDFKNRTYDNNHRTLIVGEG
ncbi:MAG: hypothetical protein NXH75_04220, partial [Halobacteriovoraceae bacterium]|nr:hypothetical protein [Halobacteriovoraceae bacterium]